MKTCCRWRWPCWWIDQNCRDESSKGSYRRIFVMNVAGGKHFAVYMSSQTCGWFCLQAWSGRVHGTHHKFDSLDEVLSNVGISDTNLEIYMLFVFCFQLYVVAWGNQRYVYDAAIFSYFKQIKRHGHRHKTINIYYRSESGVAVVGAGVFVQYINTCSWLGGGSQESLYSHPLYQCDFSVYYVFNVGSQPSESTAKELKKSAAKESAAKARAKAKAKPKTSPKGKTKPVLQPKAKGKKAPEHEPKPKGGRVKR